MINKEGAMGKVRTVSVFLVLFVLAAFLAGCGAAVSGIGKDASRIWRGGKMIFVSED